MVRASENRVVLLLFVDQTTTSTRLEGPKVDLNRVRMTMLEDGRAVAGERGRRPVTARRRAVAGPVHQAGPGRTPGAAGRKALTAGRSGSILLAP